MCLRAICSCKIVASMRKPGSCGSSLIDHKYCCKSQTAFPQKLTFNEVDIMSCSINLFRLYLPTAMIVGSFALLQFQPGDGCGSKVQIKTHSVGSSEMTFPCSVTIRTVSPGKMARSSAKSLWYNFKISKSQKRAPGW